MQYITYNFVLYTSYLCTLVNILSLRVTEYKYTRVMSSYDDANMNIAAKIKLIQEPMSLNTCTKASLCSILHLHVRHVQVHVQMGPAYFTQSTSYFRVFIAEISRLTNTKICGPARIFKTFITSLP